MSETTLRIEQTEETPFFQFDMVSGVMDLRGRSLPNSSQRFYTPILNKIERHIENTSSTFTANFAFEYFNTSSSKCLFNILRSLASYKFRGKNVVINWFYESYDDDMKETGEDYEDILGVRFNHIEL